ncbi:deoxyhypusine synthase family protein [Candidatus Woesearchaeota archaeon]|nr:deoxyhypusine synthase family protein [Candidatus Woesearchaeota archaeon]
MNGKTNPAISDIRLNRGITVAELVRQFKNSGFQTHNIAIAAEILGSMAKENATIFLSFTSNISASGIRGIIIDLVKKKKVHALVVSSGALDEDIARAKMPYLQGTFEADDSELGRKGINRMGSIFVPNECYEYLEDKITEVLNRIYSKGSKEFSATEIIRQIGLHLDTEDSFVYHAARNGIPIFCPGITDGAVGLQLAFFQQTRPDFKVNELKSALEAVDFAMTAKGKGKVGAIILGGGIAKHHTIISNVLGGGLDYAIYINSSSPYHGSLSGATTSEAKSWGKISGNAMDVTIYGDASVIFPLLIASNNYFFE